MAQATDGFSVAKRKSIPQGVIEGSNTRWRHFLLVHSTIMFNICLHGTENIHE